MWRILVWDFRATILIIGLLSSMGYELGTATLTEIFEAHKPGFSVRFNEEVNPFSVTGVFVLPKEKISFSVENPGTEPAFSFNASAGDILETRSSSWVWKAPSKPGLYVATVTSTLDNQVMTFNIFVLVPYEKMKKGYLNGYRIGPYPPDAKLNSLTYKTPRGFVEVTQKNRHIPVSPHFTLGQFLCKQSGSYPKYLVLRERLVYHLENVLEKVNNYGYRCESLTIMSGYRTPYYNKAIGNVPYSRHLWGDAADIYIDFDPSNGVMDDLNKDGTVDRQDAIVLRRIVENMFRDPMYQKFIGGLGTYRSTKSHGPFVHLDVRGSFASW